MTYKNEKSIIALELLTFNLESDFISKSELKVYTDEINLLNRKRESLLKDKVALEREVRQLKSLKPQKKKSKSHHSNSSEVSTLEKAHSLYKSKKYREAKSAYLALIDDNSFYSFLRTNIALCDKFIKEEK